MFSHLSRYAAEGEEGHDITKYRDLLSFARDHVDTVRLLGGFVPRRFAKLLVREGEEAAYQEVMRLGWMEESDRIAGTEQHYNFFDSLISGRDLGSADPPSERFRRIFPAQVRCSLL